MRVARKTRNVMRRERRANPTVDMLLARLRAETVAERALRERAEALVQEYGSKGATWAAAVQAVKTDWVASFRNKYREGQPAPGGAAGPG